MTSAAGAIGTWSVRQRFTLPIIAAAFASIVLCSSNSLRILAVDKNRAGLFQRDAGSITGRVVDAVTGAPIAGADVRAERAALPIRQFDPSRQVRAAPPAPPIITAQDGTFALPEMAGDTYNLRAYKNGYVGGAFGQQRAGGSSQTLAVHTDEAVTGIVLRLWPGSKVTGTVRDLGGAPIVGRSVLALRLTGTHWGIRLVGEGLAATTNRAGEYRLTGLSPGQYLLQATAASVAELFRTTASGLLPSRDAQPWSCFPPGSLLPSDASIISLDGSVDETVVDIAVPDRRTLPILAGRIGGIPAEVAAGTQARLTLDEDQLLIPRGLEIAISTLGPGGTFDFGRVPPGSYRIRGTSFRTADGRGVGGRPVTVPRPASVYWFDAPVKVGQSDLNDLELIASVGAVVRGTVKFDASSVAQPPVLTRGWLSIRRTDGLSDLGLTSMELRQDGTFETIPLPRGEYTVLWTDSANEWFLDKLQSPGREANQSFSVELADVADLEVVLTRARARVSGTVRDTMGVPRPDASVLVFPTDRTRRIGPVVAEIRPDRFGNYSLDLPTDSYFVVAVVGNLPENWRNSAFFQSVSTRAATVRVTRGDVRTLGLTAIALR